MRIYLKDQTETAVCAHGVALLVANDADARVQYTDTSGAEAHCAFASCRRQFDASVPGSRLKTCALAFYYFFVHFFFCALGCEQVATWQMRRHMLEK